jgi:hypothetical protein
MSTGFSRLEKILFYSVLVWFIPGWIVLWTIDRWGRLEPAGTSIFPIHMRGGIVYYVSPPIGWYIMLLIPVGFVVGLTAFVLNRLRTR